jgi:hypothetical protein
MDEFRQLLQELVIAYGGTKGALAHAIGIRPSSLSHLLGKDAPHVASTEVCLRLAIVTGTSPSRLLRAAGRGPIADLLEELYGAAAVRRQSFVGVRLTPYEEQHLAAIRALNPKARRAFFFLVECATARAATPAPPLPFGRLTRAAKELPHGRIRRTQRS